MEERMAGQAPASSERTEKYGGAAAGEETQRHRAAKIRRRWADTGDTGRPGARVVRLASLAWRGPLVGEGIPESGAEVGEIGAAGIVAIHEIRAAEEVHSQIRIRHQPNSESRTRFHVIRP